MAKYYCILFDADNTLLNFDAAENKALTETLVNYGIEPDAETVQTYHQRGTVAAAGKRPDPPREAVRRAVQPLFKDHRCRR